MISYWIDFGFSFIDSEVSWRFPIAFQIFFALVILMFILELPESPRYFRPSPFITSYIADHFQDGSFSGAMKKKLWRFLQRFPTNLPKINGFYQSSQPSKTPFLKHKVQLSRIFSLWTRIAISIASLLHTSTRCSNRSRASISVSTTAPMVAKFGHKPLFH